MLGRVTTRVVLAATIACCLVFTRCKKDDDGKTPVAVVPEVYLVLPPGGSVRGGTSAALFTRNFQDDFQQDTPEVWFGGVLATVQIPVVNPVDFFVTVPPGVAEGAVDITLTSTGLVQTASCNGCFTYGPPPSCMVTGISPDTGDVSGGDVVTISGVDFVSSPTVYFGTEMAPWAIPLDAWTIETEVPPAAGGFPETVIVQVDLSNGASCLLAPGYTYTVPQCSVGSVTPAAGPTTGLEPVTILGTDFDVQATVEFGGLQATNVAVLSSTRITCLTPAATVPGKVVVRVNNPAVSCELPDAYEYLIVGGCALDSVTPAGGSTSGQYFVTIRGSDFEMPPDPPPEVRFGGALSPTVIQDSAIQLQAEVPPGGSPGVVDVTVTNTTSGQGCTKTGWFEYLPAAQCGLYGLEPSMGPTIGGTVVTITGGNLDPIPVEILFGSEPADLGTLVWSDETTATVATPIAFIEGVVDVTYVNPGTPPVPCTLVGGFEYKNPPTGCTITSIIPSKGGRQGGTFVTIDGFDFCAQSDCSVLNEGVRVFFGGKQANQFLTCVNGTTQITCYTPGWRRDLQAPESVDVQILGVSCQTSCILPNGFTYLPGCTISGINPPGGPMRGGTMVQISGAAFDSGGNVRFGENFSPSVTVLGPGLIEAKAPPSAVSGPVDVTILGSMGTQCVSLGGYTYSAGPGGNTCDLFAVLPASGPPEGGIDVTITGSGFEPSPAPPPGVLFGFAAGDNVAVTSPSSLTVTVPPRLHQIAQVDVHVINDNGAVCTLAGGFTYDPFPTCGTNCSISTVAPSTGPPQGGGIMGIAGDGFCLGDRVYFTDGADILPAPISSFSTTMLNVTPPPAPQGATLPLVMTVYISQVNGHSCWQIDAYTYQ